MIVLNWKEQERYSLDFTYDLVIRQYSDIFFRCYGGRFYRFFLSRYYERRIYFYLTQDKILYTPSGATFTEIPFCKITNLKIKQKGQRYHIKFVADKKYHFQLYTQDWLVTDKLGSMKENAEKFIETLLTKVKV